MMATMKTKRELAATEDAGWKTMLDLVESLTPRQVEQEGYYPEGWSVKDMLAHIGNWQAEAGLVLQQIRLGTFRDDPVDVDAMNQRFFEANKDLPLPVVRAESWSARIRMLTEWNALPEVTSKAEEWFAESGPDHYEEHMDRLRDWVAELKER
ncbi:MAG: ClbS/DfsB family four-helix bundle protein [Actinobacteria bacterium]|nr:MAG: ClbS/DfsB family four-helix bundle protein [Actinomycetota bacterium]